GKHVRARDRARPCRTSLLARPVALSRAVSGPGLARYLSTLQADRDRGRLGAHSAIFDNGCVYGHFWKACWASFRWKRTLSAHGLCWASALEFFFDGSRRRF